LKPVPQPTPIRQPTTANTSLFDIISHHKDSIPAAAQDWVARYKTDAPAATSELMTLIIQAAGVTDLLISADDVDNEEMDVLRGAIDDTVLASGLTEPCRTKPAFRRFQESYNEYWHSVIAELHNSGALWDHSLQAFWKISNFLVALCTSPSFELRKWATLTARQIMTSWAQTVQILSQVRDTAERQMNADKAKKSAAAASRAAQFERTVQECTSRIRDLKDSMERTFDNVFTCRFKDKHKEIRGIVLEGITTWARLLPAFFLPDRYIKYLAWGMSDQDASVRAWATKGIAQLYSVPGNAATLADFTKRFHKRIIDLCNDESDDVVVQGVCLLTALSANGKAPAEAVETACDLLSDSNSRVRGAAAALVYTSLESQGTKVLGGGGGGGVGCNDDGAVKSKKGVNNNKKKGGAAANKAGKQGKDNSKENRFDAEDYKLAGVLSVLQQLGAVMDMKGSNIQEEEDEGYEAPRLRPDIIRDVVDALFDRVKELSNWPLIVKWMKNDWAADYFQEAGGEHLAIVLHCAIQKATSASPTSTLQQQQKQTKAATKRAADSARQEATLALMSELPGLIKKALASRPTEAIYLSMLVWELNLDLYALKKDDKNMNALLSALKAAVLAPEAGSEQELYLESTRSLLYISKEGSDKARDSGRLTLNDCLIKAAKQLNEAVGAAQATSHAQLAKDAAAYDKQSGSAATDVEGEVHSTLRFALFRVEALMRFADYMTASGGARKGGNASLVKAVEGVYLDCNTLLEMATGMSVEEGGKGAKDKKKGRKGKQQQLQQQIFTAPILRTAILLSQMCILQPFSTLKVDEEPSPEALEYIIPQRDTLCTKIHVLLLQQQDGTNTAQLHPDVVDAAMSTFSGLFAAFSARKYAGTPLARACFAPSDEEINTYWWHCESILTMSSPKDIALEQLQEEQRNQEAELGTELPRVTEDDINEEDIVADRELRERKTRVAYQISQLVLFASIPQRIQIAGKFFAVAHTPPAVKVTEPIVHTMAMCMDTIHPEFLAECFREAIIYRYKEMIAVSTQLKEMGDIVDDDEERQQGRDALEIEASEHNDDLMALADAVAKEYSGFSHGPDKVKSIMVWIAHWVLEGGEADRKELLLYTSPLVDKLTREGCEAVLESAREAIGLAEIDENAAEWNEYISFKKYVERRMAKAKVKPALKTGGGGRGFAAVGPVNAFAPAPAAPGPSHDAVAPGSRKISFARLPDDGEDDGNDDEDVDGGNSRGARAARQAARRSRGGSSAFKACQNKKKEEEQPVEEESEDDDDVPVPLPTQEILPSGKKQQQDQKKKRVLKPVFEDAIDGSDEEEDFDLDVEDSELPRLRGLTPSEPAGGKGKGRGREGKKMAETEEEEEEEGDGARARRRRRCKK